MAPEDQDTPAARPADAEHPQRRAPEAQRGRARDNPRSRAGGKSRASAAAKSAGATGVPAPAVAKSADVEKAAAGESETSGAKRSRSREPKSETLVLLPVRGMVLFPGVVLPIGLGRERSIRAVQAAVQSGQPLGVVMQTDPEQDEPGADDLHRVGTAAEILRYLTAPDGTHHAIVQGQRRFRIVAAQEARGVLEARVEPYDDAPIPAGDTTVAARFLHLKQQAGQALSLLPEKPEELDHALQSATSPALLADMVATFMDLPAEQKQEILEMQSLPARLERVSERLQHLTEVLSLSRDIRTRTRGSLDKAQREYFLREQLKQIQKELGEGEDPGLGDLTEKIAQAGLPPEAEKEAKRELARLARIPEASAEHSMVRTYLEWMSELPWSRSSEDALDLTRAATILDEDHHGLEKVKRRILETLAVRKLKPDGRGPILCLVGPPGVGKTSLGQSVARAMGRKFVRISLGGVHDEAEIRGHRRTYVGALPGNVVQALRKAGTNNPVFMLDELDKLSASIQGDPSAALLEVLDPEQNASFRDHYLGVPIDLSKAFFIGTANVLDAIPGPLLDRMEVIQLSGYTEEEKLEIARRYLVPRQRERHGLPAEVGLTDEALRAIARGYTREAGCRNLEREIAAVLRFTAARIARGEAAPPISVDAPELAAILGPQRFEDEVKLRTSVAGVSTGLAWTPAGGDVLFIEATRMPGKGELILTGQLGDVMRESARAALSLVESHAAELGIDSAVFAESDIHVHLPAGAIPKDGPSAGVTMYVALVSLLTGRHVRSDVAMTGEISLRGLVLPVGGIKDKVLAAYRAGIRTVLLPARNLKDLEDVPKSVQAEMRFEPLERTDQALEHALA